MESRVSSVASENGDFVEQEKKGDFTPVLQDFDQEKNLEFSTTQKNAKDLEKNALTRGQYPVVPEKNENFGKKLECLPRREPNKNPDFPFERLGSLQGSENSDFSENSSISDDSGEERLVRAIRAKRDMSKARAPPPVDC